VLTHAAASMQNTVDSGDADAGLQCNVFYQKWMRHQWT